MDKKILKKFISVISLILVLSTTVITGIWGIPIGGKQLPESDTANGQYEGYKYNLTDAKVSCEVVQTYETETIEDGNNITSSPEPIEAVAVKNTSNIPVYIRVISFATSRDTNNGTNGGKTRFKKMTNSDYNWTNEMPDYNKSDWFYKNGYYYYKKLVQPNETTTYLFKGKWEQGEGQLYNFDIGSYPDLALDFTFQANAFQPGYVYTNIDSNGNLYY